MGQARVAWKLCEFQSRNAWAALRLRVLLGIVLHLCVGNVRAQRTGFVSVDCGAGPATLYPDPVTGLIWQGDTSSVLPDQRAGISVVKGNAPTGQMASLRYFPSGITPAKNCYVLPVTTGSLYLVRAGFLYGNYDSQQSSAVSFQIAVQSTVWQDVTINSTSSSPVFFEAVVPSLQSTQLSVCLLRTYASSTPFINTLELRLLDGSLYQTSEPTGNPDFGRDVNFYLMYRVNFGERLRTLRYPEDLFDRIWIPYSEIFPQLLDSVSDISTTNDIKNDYMGRDRPAVAVMQTAITASSFTYTYSGGITIGNEYYIETMLAELNGFLPQGARRSISVTRSYYQPGTNFQINLTADVPPLTTYEFGSSNRTLSQNFVTTAFSRDVNSTLDPLVNAEEMYEVQTCDPGTNSIDVRAINSMKEAGINLMQWTGDPCLPVPWDELQCINRTVISLDVSGKNLTGVIPATAIGDLPSLKTLDLSSNSFKGPFPNLLGLKNLYSLNVSNNMLSGPFPRWIQNIPLQSLDVSNNQLNGTFPASLISNLGSQFRYAGNPDLLCVTEDNSVCPVSPSPPQSPPSPVPKSSEGKSSNIIPIVAGVIGGVLLLLLVVGACLLWHCCCRSAATQTGSLDEPSEAPAQAKPSEAPAQAKPLSLGRKGKAQCFSFQALNIATQNFSREIGRGGFGPVYYGVLPDGREVAVKKMEQGNCQGYKEFANEIDLLSTLHHKNLVSLVGYCQEANELILLYDYMPGGDLQGRLLVERRGSNVLSWQQRVEIALDSARGLEYLHHGCSTAVIHRDVKISNILLDKHMRARVADFGLSKWTHELGQKSTLIRGTPGYLDPEYNRTGVPTVKTDVYSFGVVLLQLLSGEPPFSSEKDGSKGGYIIDRVKLAMNTGNLFEILDPDPALREESTKESCWKVIDLAMNCVQGNGRDRPDMRSIVSELREASRLASKGPRTWPSPSGASDSSGSSAMPSYIDHVSGPHSGR